jgi:hypothetical protein
MTSDGHESRIIDAMTVVDVSLTPIPAYKDTTTAMRSRVGSLADGIAEIRSRIMSVRSGRKISGKHLALLTSAHDHLAQAQAAVAQVANADGNFVPTQATSDVAGMGGGGNTGPLSNADGSRSAEIDAVRHRLVEEARAELKRRRP